MCISWIMMMFYIFSHGSEDKLVTLMGVLQALVAVVQDNNDALRSMRAGNHQFVFLVREYLTLVAVVQDPCHFIQHILVELNYVYNQVGNALLFGTPNYHVSFEINSLITILLNSTNSIFFVSYIC